MVQWLAVYAALAENPSSVASTYIGKLRMTSDLSARGSNAFFWPLKASVSVGMCTCVCVYVHMLVHVCGEVHRNKNVF